ncbi:MAG: HEAT repeat domain-containing protein [Thermoguttaceae bacterium]
MKKSEQKISLALIIYVVFSTVLVLGCATNNEYLIKHSCFFTRKSDKIPGLIPPNERAKIIREKAERAQNASERERELVIAQLVTEYKSSSDPNMRREAVAAIAKIPHPSKVDNLKMALSDENVYVRITACRGLVRNADKNQGISPDTEHTLRHIVMSDIDKDVRIAAIQSLSKAGQKCQPETMELLEKCLSDRDLAIRYETTNTLHVCTGKDYGNNVDNWLAYFENHRNGSGAMPKERGLADKLPKPEWTMIR